ncbi:MAG: carbohydrate ABC transporter permease [Desulfofustis sp.]|nr:carbohydrate ABC transporter permease [Desulfofustis sp.]MBT8354280.1 carbohydrate ABC transporter permease [Desulfofustis sp.]NNF47517.1 carbohydrate ABC transporter permease [Desulfofustis sp.]NNK12809.1 carbohydrate ABC transporter permease [Desulfofustis sp.]NNK58044.1 carbohydrate ABC transporter permease [Desulfofustis sp.]
MTEGGQKTYAERLARAVVYVVLLLFVVYFLAPLFIMIITSIKPMSEIRTGTLISLPRSPTVEPWLKAWGSATIGVSNEGIKGFFVNSLKITIPAVLISTLIGAVNGYVLSKWKFKGSDAFFAMLLLGCFIPFQVILLPMARTLGLLGISGTTAGLVLVHTVYGLAFTTLFFRNFYVGIPDELVNAAKIDGAGFWRIFWKIMLPVSKPIIMVTIIWQTTQIWNDFLFGVCFSTGETQPVTVALNNLVNTSSAVKEYNVDMAAAIIAAIPTLFVYFAAGKYFVRGLTAGAVKG